MFKHLTSCRYNALECLGNRFGWSKLFLLGRFVFFAAFLSLYLPFLPLLSLFLLQFVLFLDLSILLGDILNLLLPVVVHELLDLLLDYQEPLSLLLLQLFRCLV